MNSPRTPSIERGMNFMPRSSTVGTDTVGSWEVIDLFEGSDGIPYARLANATDRSRIKTVARAELLNRKLYRRVK